MYRQKEDFIRFDCVRIAAAVDKINKMADCRLSLSLLEGKQDLISENYDNYVVLGDLNFDMLEKSKGCKLINVCDVFDLSNVIKEPACFTSAINLLLLM